MRSRVSGANRRAESEGASPPSIADRESWKTPADSIEIFPASSISTWSDASTVIPAWTRARTISGFEGSSFDETIATACSRARWR